MLYRALFRLASLKESKKSHRFLGEPLRHRMQGRRCFKEEVASGVHCRAGYACFRAMAFAVRAVCVWRTSPPSSSKSASLLKLQYPSLDRRGGLKQANPSQLCGVTAVLRASTSGCWECKRA